MTTHVERIIVGVDGSDNSRHALEWAILLAQRFDATVVAVHAMGLLTQLGDGPPVPSQSHRDELQAVFESEWCAPLVTSGVSHRYLFRDGPPVMVLLDAADQQKADLIVVGSRGTGGFSELMLGSTSHHVAEHSVCPVLIVPALGRA
jgi:nucleotide-binding universal stress UspA family protein